MANVVAVVVTYRPELSRLQNLLDATTPQVAHVVVVDNGNGACFVPQNPRLHFLSMGDNLGIAKAQNEGIKRAKTLDATHVLLLDQDSVPAPDMVEELLKALASLPDAACVGPRYLDDRRKSLSPFIRTQGLRRIHCACTYPDEIIEADQLIASGALVPMNAFERVGVMREDFFIGCVDTEWGLRAKAQGRKSYGVCSAHMRHRLGEEPISLFGKTFPSNTPLRNLYHSRNALLLYREPWLPLKWKVIDGYHLLIKFVFYSLFAKPRFEHFKMMSLGFLDGIRGKGGKFQGLAH